MLPFRYKVTVIIEERCLLMFCPNCGIELAEGAAFCKECGTRVPPSADSTMESRPRCPVCGRELPEGAAFCKACGTRVDAGEYMGTTSSGYTVWFRENMHFGDNDDLSYIRDSISLK